MQAQLDVLGGQAAHPPALPRPHRATRCRVVRSWRAAIGVDPAARRRRRGHGRRRSRRPATSLAAQEQLRREIARQMHDGPAQSIANIALQAQIVERLFERDPARASAELSELVAMVQQALEATKTFIFDVRPMVLDDLGLVPTLRRSAAGAQPPTDECRGSLRVGRHGPAPAERDREWPFPDGRRRRRAYHRLFAPTAVMVRLDWAETARSAPRSMARRHAASRPTSSRRARPSRPRAATRTLPRSWPR